MSKKRTWKAHNMALIKQHKKCAGDVPPTGGMEDLLSEKDFLAMAHASGIHPWNSCHYVDEVLGLVPTDSMREIKTTGDPQKLVDNLESLKEPLNEVKRSQKLAEFKDRMKRYVDRVEFKGEKLVVPAQLLRFSDYVDKFFG